jgi:short-subunit dehydrogenase
MRQAGRGLIVYVGSFAEMTPVPCSAVYAGAKATMRVLLSGLRQEVRAFGIRVVTVAPTFVKTPIHQERLSCDGVYEGMIRASGSVRDRSIASGADPAVVADKILKILSKKNPRSFYPSGKTRGFCLPCAVSYLSRRARRPSENVSVYSYWKRGNK